MKSNSNGNGKKIAGIIVSAALCVSSFFTVAASAANNNDVVQKDTVMTAPALPSPTETTTTTQGTIQYSTDAYSRADGSQDVTFTRWYNPETKEMRSDIKEYNSAHQVTRYQSTYYLNNELIIIQRDVNSGNPLSGTISNRSDQPEVFEKLDANGGFDSVKASFTDGHWTSVGTEQTTDGKTLNKLSSEIYQSYINDTTQANMQLIEYLDEATGLPVKEELYEDSTGQYKLFSSDTSEYKYIEDDGTIFKTDIGVTLAPYTDK